MASAEVLSLGDGNWDAEVLRSPVPVLAGFWAGWCVPSRSVPPTLEALAGRYAGALRFGSVDADASPGLVGRYAIKGLPTLLLLRGGEVAERRVGLVEPEELIDLLEKA